jgi:hypothetical protein
MRFKQTVQTNNSGTFLKLKAGESARGIFSGDPYEFKVHWNAGKTTPCLEVNCPQCNAGNKSAFRFTINVIVKENEAYVAKIFEQGISVYDALKSLHEGGYDLEKHVMKISRQGSTKDDTTYAIVPLPNGQINAEMALKLKDVKLHPLNPQKQQEPSNIGSWETPKDSDFVPNESSELPF